MIRQWLESPDFFISLKGEFTVVGQRHCRVLCEVLPLPSVRRLHGNVFKPHTGTKTSVLLVQKWDDKLCPKVDDYPIFFATMQEPSKDNSGEKIFVRKKDFPKSSKKTDHVNEVAEPVDHYEATPQALEEYLLHRWIWNRMRDSLKFYPRTLFFHSYHSKDKILLSIGFDESYFPRKLPKNVNLIRYKDIKGEIHSKDLTNFDSFSDSQIMFIDDIKLNENQNVNYYLISAGSRRSSKDFMWICLLKCSINGIEIVNDGLNGKSSILMEQDKKFREYFFSYDSENQLIQYCLENNCNEEYNKKNIIWLKFNGNKFVKTK